VSFTFSPAAAAAAAPPAARETLEHGVLAAAVEKLRAENPGLGVKKLVLAVQALHPTACVDTKSVRAAVQAQDGGEPAEAPAQSAAATAKAPAAAKPAPGKAAADGASGDGVSKKKARKQAKIKQTHSKSNSMGIKLPTEGKPLTQSEIDANIARAVLGPQPAHKSRGAKPPPLPAVASISGSCATLRTGGGGGGFGGATGGSVRIAPPPRLSITLCAAVRRLYLYGCLQQVRQMKVVTQPQGTTTSSKQPAASAKKPAKKAAEDRMLDELAADPAVNFEEASSKQSAARAVVPAAPPPTKPGASSPPREGRDWAERADTATVPLSAVRARPGRLSALSISHSKSGLYGAFVWARRALNSQKTAVSGASCRRLFGLLFTYYCKRLLVPVLSH
jgi:hypothetical protein